MQTSRSTVHVIRAFYVKSLGIHAELEHSLNGLPSGTKLHSTDKKTWEVVYRIRTSPGSVKRTDFPNETTHTIFVRHAQHVDLESVFKQQEERDAQGIYEYLLEPIDPSAIPREGERLTVETVQSE